MDKAKASYYDIEIDIDRALLDGGMIDELFYLKDLQQRKLFLNQDVDQLSVADIVKHILQMNAEDKDIPVEERRPILLYVVSN